MTGTNFIQQSIFILRLKKIAAINSLFRKYWLTLSGMHIGKGTMISRIFITWPHKVSIGSNCTIEHSVYFKYDGIWSPGRSIRLGDNVFIGCNTEFNINTGITVGNDSLIASGCRFVDHNHGIALDDLMRIQHSTKAEITIGSDVWIGFNAVILKGVTIDNGAIVAAGAVVTRSIPALEIWGGIPAVKIGNRNDTKFSYNKIEVQQ